LFGLNNQSRFSGSGGHGIKLKTEAVFCASATSLNKPGIGKGREGSRYLSFIAAGELGYFIYSQTVFFDRDVRGEHFQDLQVSSKTSGIAPGGWF
jgi:hypothetical protein